MKVITKLLSAIPPKEYFVDIEKQYTIVQTLVRIFYCCIAYFAIVATQDWVRYSSIQEIWPL